LKYCPCSAGYVEDGDATCSVGPNLTCSITCETCSGPAKNQCLSCKSQSNRVLSGTTCVCVSGYYDYNSRNCMKSSCLYCSLQQTSNYLATQSTIFQLFPLYPLPIVSNT
jgi:hypothetical protein